MYSFDEFGNVLIDASQEELIQTAARNRTISQRAQALVQNQFIPFQPVTPATWNLFTQRLGSLFSGVFSKMRVPNRAGAAPVPRGAGDFKAIFIKVINDWASADLQGFHGPIPSAELGGISTLAFFLPADGAVIRYLGRLQRKYPGFFQIDIASGNIFQGRIATLDNTTATFGPNLHGMVIRVRETLGGTLTSGRIDNNVNTLRALRRTLDIDEVIIGIGQVIATLSRKIRSQDGSWGEDPKFPIVDFQRKVGFQDWVSLQSYDRNFHGNNKDLYADRSVYSIIPDGDKLPFVQSSGPSGEYKWTQPRS